MPLWNIFGNKKKKIQAKRNHVRLLARNRGVRLTDDQIDLLDDVMINTIITLDFFNDIAATAVGAEIPEEVLVAEQNAGLDMPVQSAYNEAREIASATESVTIEEVTEEPKPEPKHIRTPDPEPSYTPDPAPEPIRSSSSSSSYDGGSSYSDSGDSGGSD